MALSSLTPALLAAKKAQGLSFSDLGALVGADEVWVAALLYGQATATAEQAATLLDTLKLDPALAPQLTNFPVKGALDPVIPTDPLLYRFYEILQVYGLPLKDVIQEKFGGVQHIGATPGCGVPFLVWKGFPVVFPRLDLNQLSRTTAHPMQEPSMMRADVNRALRIEIAAAFTGDS